MTLPLEPSRREVVSLVLLPVVGLPDVRGPPLRVETVVVPFHLDLRRTRDWRTSEVQDSDPELTILLFSDLPRQGWTA